jgi:hypothetical protein
MRQTVSRTLQAVELLRLTRPFDLYWSSAERQVVNLLVDEKILKWKQISTSLHITTSRLNYVIREIVKRLRPFAQAIQSGAFDYANVRTWPLVLLNLDRSLEARLAGRHITMVADLLGREAPLAKPEFRKGLGRLMLGSLEEKLKASGLLDELAWKTADRTDPRRAMQDEIEQRIDELNRRATATRSPELINGRGRINRRLKSLP